MTAEMALHDIDAVLEAEREAILAGRLEDVSRLVAQKERLLDSTNFAEIHPDDLKRLRAKAQRNEQLLSSAMAGLRRAMARIEELREGGTGLNTYTQSGGKTALGTGGAPRVEKKA
ncbi:hypothetical protein [Aliiroseovarius sp. YM-037]|uniref:hypothetical protein n=1 Tax=Aliiroseovarius sp. YM-037 TaxID=3341728 RepID=UPI003A7FD180